MAAGAWVFPIGMVGFILFLATFLAANPAVPATFLVVKPGDTITYEETAFYDDGLVAWTTREDLLQAGSLRIGPYGLIPKPSSLTAHLPGDVSNITDPLVAALVGAHANETVRTEPKDDYFGGWERNVTANRTIAEFPIQITVQSGQNIGGRIFNATQFAAEQRQQLGRDVGPGDRVACDFGTCEIQSIDANQVTYRHVVVDGATLPIDRFVFFPEQEPKPRSQLEMRSAGPERFRVLWAPVEGDAFILRSNFASFPPGYYRLGPFTEESMDVQYRGTEALTGQGNLVPAHLIGQRVWFELLVTHIG